MDLFGDTDPRRMPPHFFWSAIRVDYSTAQRADTSQQNLTVAPRHWYLDAYIRCCDCQEVFRFDASEQCFWYEELKFYVDSFPKRCTACRQRERAPKALRKQYDSLINFALKSPAGDDKRAIITILDKLEAIVGELPDKMK